MNLRDHMQTSRMRRQRKWKQEQRRNAENNSSKLVSGEKELGHVLNCDIHKTLRLYERKAYTYSAKLYKMFWLIKYVCRPL
jgi:hypothetical protein